jgi:2-haloacid dehalogenase
MAPLTPLTPLPVPAGVVFDAYGTLFDVHSVVSRLKSTLGDRADEVSNRWRAKQLEYTWLRSLMGEFVVFETVTADALDMAFEEFGIKDPALKQELLAAYDHLDPFPEVASVLTAIKASGCPAAVLSNGSSERLAAAVRRSKIEKTLELLLSAESVRVYKPHRKVYDLACKAFRVDAGRLLFVSANAWDIAGASCFGLKTVWVNRFGARPERLPGGADAEITDLNGLLSLVDFSQVNR